MAGSTYRVGVLLDLAAGRFRSGAKGAAKDTDRLGGSLRKLAGSGSLMGRGVAEGARRARRALFGTSEEAQRLGRTLRRSGRDGEQSVGRLTRRLRGLRTEAGLAARAAGGLRGRIGGVAGILGIAGGGFAIAAGLRRVITMEERMERLGIQASRSTKDMARLREEVYATANLPEIRLDPSQLLAGIEAIVEKTGDLDFARDNMMLLAQSIQASGGTGDALGRLSAELRKLGITDPAGVARALNLITAQGKSGAFTLGNMAAQGERLFSAFARLGYQGGGAVRQLGAISQMARQSTGSSEQAATAVEALLRTLSDAGKIDDIWHELGVNVRDATGAFRPLDLIIKEIVNEAGGDITRLSEIFDAEALRAISGLTTARGQADYERFLAFDGKRDAHGRFRPGPDMLARDAARIAQTPGAQIQETKTDVEDWMQDKLTGPLGEVVGALTSFKDELLVGVGLLAGSWYAFKALRGTGRLLWRLAGGGGAPPGMPAAGGPASPKPPPHPPSLTGGGPTGRPRNAWPESRRQASLVRSQAEAARWEATRATREGAARRTASLTRSREVSLMRSREEAAKRERARSTREVAARREASLMRPEAVKSGPTTRPRNVWTGLGGTGPTTRPRNNVWADARRQAALMRSQAEAAKRERARSTREVAARREASLMRPEAVKSGPTTRPRNVWTGLGGTGPTTRPRNNVWADARRQAALMRSQAEAAKRERARSTREVAARREASLMRPEAVKSGPTTRPRNVWTGLGGTGPTTRPRNNVWADARRQAALMRSQAEAAKRERARSTREVAARREASLTRERSPKRSLMRSSAGRVTGASGSATSCWTLRRLKPPTDADAARFVPLRGRARRGRIPGAAAPIATALVDPRALRPPARARGPGS